MEAWILPLITSVLQARKRQEDEAKERRNAQVDLHTQRAQSLGYPAYGVQAAQKDAELEDEYGGGLGDLLPFLSSRRR